METTLIILSCIVVVVIAALVTYVLVQQSARANERALAAQKELFEKTIAEMKASMNAQTAQMLQERQKDFAESSTRQLGDILNPLKENIREMKSAMSEARNAQTAMTTEMRAKIEELVRQTSLTKQSADELTNALKHGSKVQGDWGEQILDELLQAQGLIPGVHYDVQAVIKDEQGKPVHGENGRIMRPDIILHLDKQRDVIIDSKVSLTAFIDFANAETETERQMYLKQHMESLQQHVRELSEKDYASYVQPPKIRMNYVIMFVPHTGALWTALNAQPDLWRKAMDKNVFIADEQTLFAALRIIHLTWTQIQQAENHERVYELADQMIERVGMFLKHYERVGDALDRAQAAYDEAKKKLDPQGQSILTTANNLKKLGAKQNANYPVLDSM
ncbi:MAG: DNA recombination protein RmuC [Paludibacteraceae bacterium]|nr:DNA recombination protein RmuC [Paludibacteraceae bacterium]